jgi:uncharacterized NAD-dependent epimerase/dehydratase family protein
VDGWDKIARRDVIKAIDLKLNVDCGLHDFLSEDEKIARQASMRGVILRDIRKPPSRNQLHFFSGKIEQVDTLENRRAGHRFGRGEADHRLADGAGV